MRNPSEQTASPLTWVEVDLNAVKHNLKIIRKLAIRNACPMPSRSETCQSKKIPTEILAVIKAEAYGHGMARVGNLLQSQGVCCFGVSDVAEGIRLREAGIKGKILLFEAALPASVGLIIDYDLMPTVCDMLFAKALDRYARKQKKRALIHVKIDTGMGRLGVWHREAFEFVKGLFKLRHLIVQGILTHFPVADTHRQFTQTQIQTLYDLVMRLDKKGMVISYIHAANSMGLADYQTHVLNLARPGLMLYGLYPDLKLKKNIYLRPALSVRSKVIYVKTISKGRSVSYGRTFISKREMRIATIPIGYNDGYFRAFSNKACVLVKGARCPVIGKVTMDQIMVDVSKLTGVRLGTPVTLLGTQNKATISADELAQYAKTINYEIVCSLGSRLPRVYRGG